MFQHKHLVLHREHLLGEALPFDATLAWGAIERNRKDYN